MHDRILSHPFTFFSRVPPSTRRPLLSPGCGLLLVALLSCNSDDASSRGDSTPESSKQGNTTTPLSLHEAHDDESNESDDLPPKPPSDGSPTKPADSDTIEQDRKHNNHLPQPYSVEPHNGTSGLGGIPPQAPHTETPPWAACNDDEPPPPYTSFSRLGTNKLPSPAALGDAKRAEESPRRHIRRLLQQSKQGKRISITEIPTYVSPFGKPTKDTTTTHLCVAAQVGDSQLVDEVLANYGQGPQAVKAKHEDAKEALFSANYHDTEIIKKLVEASGGNPSADTESEQLIKQGRTGEIINPLHEAMRASNIALVQYMTKNYDCRQAARHIIKYKRHTLEDLPPALIQALVDAAKLSEEKDVTGYLLSLDAHTRERINVAFLACILKSKCIQRIKSDYCTIEVKLTFKQVLKRILQLVSVQVPVNLPLVKMLVEVYHVDPYKKDAKGRNDDDVRYNDALSVLEYCDKHLNKQVESKVLAYFFAQTIEEQVPAENRAAARKEKNKTEKKKKKAILRLNIAHESKPLNSGRVWDLIDAKRLESLPPKDVVALLKKSIMHNDDDLLQVMLKQTCVQEGQKNEVLQFAVAKKQWYHVMLLVLGGANPFHRKQNFLKTMLSEAKYWQAYMKRCVNVIFGHKDCTQAHKDEVLKAAVSRDHCAAILVLLEAGACPFTAGKKGGLSKKGKKPYNALSLLLRGYTDMKKRKECVEVMLEHKSCTQAHKDKALQVAVSRAIKTIGHCDTTIIQIIIKAGANPSAMIRLIKQDLNNEKSTTGQRQNMQEICNAMERALKEKRECCQVDTLCIQIVD